MTLKSLAKSILPRSTFEFIRSVRSRRFQKRLLEREGIPRASREFIERNGASVLYGPFTGMVYPMRSALCRQVIPKLMGTYEEELHPAIRLTSARSYDLVIDIGCAEGYYAVGLARMLRTKVLAFDPEPFERRFCADMARLNGVEELVELRTLFLPSEIERLCDKRALCICDCEGFEEVLFSEETVGKTARWDLLIELHGTAEQSLPNLPWPQGIQVIESAPRTGAYRELDGIGESRVLLSEGRAMGQRWLWCDSAL